MDTRGAGREGRGRRGSSPVPLTKHGPRRVIRVPEVHQKKRKNFDNFLFENRSSWRGHSTATRVAKRDAWRKALNTSTHTSADDPSPKKSDVASARAAAHPKREHHRIRQACSFTHEVWLVPRLCLGQETYESQCLREPPAFDFHGEHHQSGLAPSSGYVRSFLRLAATRATPSRSAAPQCVDPSPRRGATIVVSTASERLRRRASHQQQPPVCDCPRRSEQ